MRRRLMLDYAQATNFSLWPFSIPLGLGFLYVSFQKRSLRLSACAAPLLLPYVFLFAWSVLVAASSHKRWIVMTISAAFWMFVMVGAWLIFVNYPLQTQ